MNLEQQLKLQAFLDGELPEAEAREILAWTQRDGAAAALLAELGHAREALARGRLSASVPETREFYWSKIEREVQRQRPAPARRFSTAALFRWLAFPAAGAAALLMVAWHFRSPAPKTVADTNADADEPVVETTLANSDATTYRNASDGTTLVWFSYENTGAAKQPKPTAVN